MKSFSVINGHFPGDTEYGGLHYEWGRKDPFIKGGFGGATNDYSVVPADVFDYITDVSTMELCATNATLSYATAHPSSFTPGTGAWWTYGNIEPERVATDLWNKNKTKYDPCPAGWRVPDYETLYKCPTTAINSYLLNSNHIWGNFIWEDPTVHTYGTLYGITSNVYLTDALSVR